MDTKKNGLKEPQGSLEPKCWCGGYIATKIDKNTRFPYQCMKCGTNYGTLPPSTNTNIIFKLFEKFFLKP